MTEERITSQTEMTAETPLQLPDNIGSWQHAAGKVLRPAFRLLWDIEVIGSEHLPKSGPAILCPNHLSVIDSFILPAILPRPIFYVGKSEYLDDWKTKTLFPRLGMIPIDRSGGGKADAALETARAVLRSGGLFGIYPEGTRSRTGRLHKGHTGAARLAIETGAPIIPVGLLGTVEIQPPDKPIPNFFKSATVKFGTPIEVDRYRSRIGDRAIYRRLIDEVMFEIQHLTGQVYDNTYASKANSALAKGTVDPEPTSAPVPAERVEPVEERRSSAEALQSRPLITLS